MDKIIFVLDNDGNEFLFKEDLLGLAQDGDLYDDTLVYVYELKKKGKIKVKTTVTVE